jgi:hypothetical protein
MNLGYFDILSIILFVFKLAGIAGVSWGLASIPWWVIFLPVIVGVFWTIVISGLILGTLAD